MVTSEQRFYSLVTDHYSPSPLPLRLRSCGKCDDLRAVPETASADRAALVVDLDGTLLATDLLHESALLLAKHHPLALLRLPFWLARGKARMKTEIAERVLPDVAALPYREDVLEFIHAARRKGRRVVLATASHQRLAQAVAVHLDCFDAVLATDITTNLSGAAKLDAIHTQLRGAPFEYLGDSDVDHVVWEEATACHAVEPSRAIEERLVASGKMGRLFIRENAPHWSLLRALRPLQWAKNALLFVPAVLAHQLDDWPMLLLAFAAFCLCASGVYVLNDLFDIESDRRHPRKRTRPFASGLVAIRRGVMLAVLLPAMSAVVASFVSWPFAGWLACYFALTCAYSAWLKRKLVVDVVALPGLYTVRLLAGASVAEVEVSAWLLAFGMFFFLSLAFAKRFTELLPLTDLPEKWLPGRGYVGADVDIIRVLGPVSGYLAVLVLALYIDSDKVRSLYAEPTRLWFECPALLYWITRLWFFAQRRALHDDPVVFALTDPESWVVAAWMAGVAVWAAQG